MDEDDDDDVRMRAGSRSDTGGKQNFVHGMVMVVAVVVRYCTL
jgi:hypothetical protein